jgi:hypothetical protein
LGNGSTSQILPELTSADTVVGSSLALPSLVNIQGQSIHLATNSILYAPGAALPVGSNSIVPVDFAGVSLKAGMTLGAGNWVNYGTKPVFSQISGQIYLDGGATIDASGSANVTASVTENIVTAQLRGTELADSPLQLNGALRGQTVQVDILRTGVYNGQAWVGTPLANLNGYANLVEHTVGELTANGGTVAINAGESVVMQPGSSINVSGGWINYQGGMVTTTKVVSGGHIYDISQATPDRVYSGILSGFTVNKTKWGITQTFSTPLLGGAYYQAGYIEGGEGGGISIKAPSMALDGSLLGNTVTGTRQLSSNPNTSALSLIFQAQDATSLQYYSPTTPNVTFQSGIKLTPADTFSLNAGVPISLRSDRKAEVILSPDLVNQYGFGLLTVDNSDDSGKKSAVGTSITVPANVTMTTAAGGSITFLAANIDIQGNLNSPGGNLTLRWDRLSAEQALLRT